MFAIVASVTPIISVGGLGAFVCISHHACVGSLRVLQLPPTARRSAHGGWVNRESMTKVTLDVNTSVCFSILSWVCDELLIYPATPETPLKKKRRQWLMMRISVLKVHVDEIK